MLWFLSVPAGHATPDEGLPYCRRVSQLSFFSAESVPPAVADLTGVLAAAGQVVTVGGGARLSVVVDAVWRAAALADMMVAAGLTAEITRTEEDTPLVRTAVDVRLALHAAHLALPHPATGERLVLAAPPPAEPPWDRFAEAITAALAAWPSGSPFANTGRSDPDR